MNKIARLSLIVSAVLGLGLGFTTYADAMPGSKPQGATLQDLQQSSSAPEIAAAEQRVEQAKAQVDLANKQVSAARALLKAAQADLKAAQTEVQALKLSAAAQGLVEQTGMTPAKASPVAIAAKSTEPDTNKDSKPAQAPTPGTPVDAQNNNSSNSTIVDPPAEPIQLR